MKQPSVYVKMQVLGAIDVVAGRTRHERIHHVAKMTFFDEEGEPHQFTWRTIQTWYYRYKNHGVTAMDSNPRADKGRTRKVTPEEVLEAMIKALRAAFYKRGLPEQLLVDNGSIYCCQEITLVCARVGCILRHTAVRDAAAKGKIERFFRRVRDQFLVRNLDLSSLSELNKQFTQWVEHEYNASQHATLGMKPIDRFGIDLSRIRFLSPSEDTDELFYAEAIRTVKKDNTFSFRGVRYETPLDLRGKKIELRYQRERQGTVVVYDQGRRIGKARPLDAVANGLKRSKESA